MIFGSAELRPDRIPKPKSNQNLIDAAKYDI